MMAFLGVVGVCGFVVWPVVYGIRRQEKRARRSLVAAPGEDEAKRLALLMARCLDRALGDPMARQSTEWEDEAHALVDRYYGKGLKG